MITFVTPPALLLFIDTVGREHIRTCYAKKKGGSLETGLSDVIVVHSYLHLTFIVYIALNYRHLADFYTNCASVMTFNSMIANVTDKEK